MSHSHLVLPIALMLLAAPVQAQLYRWVDEQGNVHYSDHLPPQATQRKREVLDEQGRILESYDPEAERRAAEARAREQARLEAERAKQEAQARHDRMLLKTYTTVEDIELVRDDRLAALDTALRLAREKLERLRGNLARLENRARELNRAGEPLSKELVRQLAEARRQVREQEAYVARKDVERAETVRRFTADIERFKELKQAGR